MNIIPRGQVFNNCISQQAIPPNAFRALLPEIDGVLQMKSVQQCPDCGAGLRMPPADTRAIGCTSTNCPMEFKVVWAMWTY